jgi:hypothetical protein
MRMLPAAVRTANPFTVLDKGSVTFESYSGRIRGARIPARQVCAPNHAHRRPVLGKRTGQGNAHLSSMFPFSRPWAALAAVTSLSGLWLSGCGGGSSQNLQVDFGYSAQPDAYLWSDTTMRPNISGLEGHEPTCKLRSGTLPAGLSLGRHSCVVSGVPTETGDYFVGIELSASGFDGSVSNNLTFRVVPPEVKYELNTDQQAWGEPMTPVSPAWTGYLPTAGDSIQYSLYGHDELPAGLSLNSATGEISGMAVDNNANLTGSVSVIGRITRAGQTVEVGAVYNYWFDAPLVVYPDVNGKVGQPFVQMPSLPTALRDGGYVMHFEVDHTRSTCNGFSPFTINAETGQLSGTPTMSQAVCLVEVEWTATKGSMVLSHSTIAGYSIAD